MTDQTHDNTNTDVQAIAAREAAVAREAEFFDALAKAQSEVQDAVRNSTNPHFQSRYADLQSVWAAIREPFTKHGLSILQLPDYDPERKIAVVTTVVGHKAGHKLSFRTTMPVSKDNAHGAGSGITYAKRYALQSVGGVAPDDDDGNAAIETSGGSVKPRATTDTGTSAPWEE